MLWVGHRKVTAAELADNPVLWPVTIKAGALGSGVPTRTLRLSRHHRVRVDGRIAERMGGASLLVPAHALLDLEGVTCSPEASGITWHHILLPGHAVLLAEGAPAESLYLGRELTKALSSGAIEELAQIFPNRPWVSGSAPRAHPFLSPSKARKLVARHIRHNRPLVSLRAA